MRPLPIMPICMSGGNDMAKTYSISNGWQNNAIKKHGSGTAETGQRRAPNFFQF